MKVVRSTKEEKMYKYRNKKNGAVIETKSRIYGGGWEGISAVKNKEPVPEKEEADATEEELPEAADAPETDEPEAAEEPTKAPEQDEKPAKKKGATIKPTKGK